MIVQRERQHGLTRARCWSVFVFALLVQTRHVHIELYMESSDRELRFRIHPTSYIKLQVNVSDFESMASAV